MATFEFRRHSIKDGEKPGTIGMQGKLLARTVGSELMRGKKFDLYCVSAIERTLQTLEAFAEGAGWTDIATKTQHAPLYINSPELQQMWAVCREAEKTGGDMVTAAFSHDADLAERTSTAIVQLFEEWVLSLPRDASVLVIGHSPHLELLAYGIGKQRLPGLKECHGFRIHTRVLGDHDQKDVDRNEMEVSCILETKADDFDPSKIRSEMFDIPTAPDTVRGFTQRW